MNDSVDPWVPLSSDALAARRAELRRRVRRRRLAPLAVSAIATVAFLAGLLTSSGGGRRAQASVAGRTNVAAPHSSEPSASTVRPARPHDSAAQALRARENAAIDRLLTRQPFITAGGGERREIALTFDDGPGPYTPRLLDRLQRLHVPATFFEIGFMFQWFHASATRELRMGDVIGDHTETHPMMAFLSPAAQQSEILTQTEWVHKYGGPFPRLWRPPYGSYDAATLAILHRFHMLMVLWTVDTNDYLRPGVAAIVHSAVAGARPGAIILMHDAGGDRTQTIAALPLIVHALRKRGYRLVTIPQLVLDDPPLRPQPLPTNLAGNG
ncbi:MAG: polysaccharide deacetylase family protein [Solirubrobacteraceae bacterium]